MSSDRDRGHRQMTMTMVVVMVIVTGGNDHNDDDDDNNDIIISAPYSDVYHEGHLQFNLLGNS